MNFSFRRKGFAILTSTWVFLLFSFGLLITAHFLGQRLRAMKRLDRIEGRIHKLHRDNFQGKRKFWPSFDRPPKAKSSGQPELTRLKKVTPHHIAIDFGGN